MNKDVIYVEPDNDITDIITKIENSPEKIVALVPPKKAAVFRSMVNIKLIARAAASSEKTVVLVTVDPSIVRLAAATKIPVTKDLKTPPTIPEVEEEVETVEEAVIEQSEPDGEEIELAEEEKTEGEEGKTDEPGEEDEDSEEDEKDDKKAKKAAKKAKKDKKAKKEGGFKGWIKAHKVPVIIASVAAVCAIVFLVWAFGFAPAVTVGVEIQTETRGFADNVSFTTVAADEDAKNGVFYIQEKQTSQNQEVKFDATGKKNVGEKAKGSITISAIFDIDEPSSIDIISGSTTFSSAGLTFIADENKSLSYNGTGSGLKNCVNENPTKEEACQMTTTVSVIAAEPGSQYNLAATSQWSSSINASGFTSSQMNGGTDKEVKVVEQIDVEKAKDQIVASNEAEIKKKLMSEVGNNMMAIDSSYKIETGNAEATPGVGQEVGDGVTPVVKVVTTASIYAIDKTKLEEFITEKADIPGDQKVYEVRDPFIENFAEVNGVYTARLKANYNVGPKVTDSDVVNRIKGKGLGEVQHNLKAINGVVNVTIDKSFPWVMSVPNDENKITVHIDVKESQADAKENQSKQGSEQSDN